MTTETLRLKGQLIAFARDMNQLYRRERARSRQLESTLQELHESYLATIHTLAQVVEAKDPQTKAHLDRTQQYSIELARAVAPALGDEAGIRYGSLLHDIGKIGLPETILNKAGPLTPEEQEIMHVHPLLGGKICASVKFLWPAIPLIEGHHERWDGGGYPRGLKGEEIPLFARIFAIADAFDAMTSDRPYRAALTFDEAVAEIAAHSGRQFDPEIVLVFVAMCEGLDSPFRKGPRGIAT